MTQTAIRSIEVRPVEPIRGLTFEVPAAGQAFARFSLDIQAWITSDTPIVSIGVFVNEHLSRYVPLHSRTFAPPSDDPAGIAVHRAGFGTAVGLVGYPGKSTVHLVPVIERNGSNVHLPAAADLAVERSPLVLDGQAAIRPLIVTSLGRTGTTYFLKLLSEHPEIVTYQRYPYEYRTAQYWLQMIRVLSEPANLEQSSHPDQFQEDPWKIGHHPYNWFFYPAQRDWFGDRYALNVVEFGVRQIQECYRHLASTQGRSQVPAYFVEKYLPNHMPDLALDVFPRGKEIVFVRDFRDMAASVLAFNRKRGKEGFVPSGTSLEAAIRQFSQGAGKLMRRYAERQPEALLVRYEDLVHEPRATLLRILRFVDLPMTDDIVDGMIARANAPAREMLDHRTSPSPEASIGRWRTDLPESVRELAQQVLAEPLRAAGYVD